MNNTIRLPQEVIELAKKYADYNLRTISKQIEYWITIGRISDDNPDLTGSFIKQNIRSLKEASNNDLSDFKLQEG